MTVSYLKEKLKNSKQPIKTALLDQSIISGLGNIYADEVCFISKLHPLTLASSLSEEDLKKVLPYVDTVTFEHLDPEIVKKALAK